MSAEIPMKSRHVHNTKQRFEFYTLVKDAYTESKFNDPEFAKMATARLGWFCNADHVKNARKDLGIPANMPQAVKNPGGANGHLAIRVRQIEAWLGRNWPGWDKE